MKTGLHRGISFAEYLKIEAINKSGLDWFRYSPAHFMASQNEVREEPTAAMKLGTAIHTAVLEPTEFHSRYLVAPKCDRRTKEGKHVYEEFLAKLDGKEAISSEDFGTCIEIRESVFKNEAAAALLDTGDSEVTMIWEDPIEGVLCKARIDWLCAVILDLKSSADASPSQFSKQVANLGWHIQDAFYSDGWKVLHGEEIPFVMGALEKSPPYASAFYSLDEESRDAGRKLYRKWLADYARCLGRNEWPSYAPEISQLRLPPWALKGSLDVITEF